jgi:ATP-dependent protease Clp ATPase subunit
MEDKKCVICGTKEGKLHKIFAEKDVHICSDCLKRISEFIKNM